MESAWRSERSPFGGCSRKKRAGINVPCLLTDLRGLRGEGLSVTPTQILPQLIYRESARARHQRRDRALSPNRLRNVTVYLLLCRPMSLCRYLSVSWSARVRLL
ncbi:hypothetical protein EVAR_33585_1 [Eumeta japonica]|uniref:Uncharacterized protein n=1 Tax=Eumeta variegata TaxID=151549 RepID=A0A4C1VLU9_EUMVA|nr:hypothetical protein EVAR_33585_1 [Eumeta japonica]